MSTFIEIVELNTDVMNAKINRELKVLLDEGIISQEVATKIADYYVLKDSEKPNRLFMIFGVFGALLVGTGIILMVAHNWDDLTRWSKTIFAFIPLLIGQLLVGFSILKNKSATWKEASGTFLFFAVGACLALISQIYNIPGDLRNFLLIWVILCLPLIYILKSSSVAFLSLIWSTYYASEVGIWSYSDKQTPWMYFIFLLAIIPYYVELLKSKISSNSVTIFNWLLPISMLIAITAFLGDYGAVRVVFYITLFGLLYNIGKLPFFSNLVTFKNGYRIVGSLGTIITLLIFSFRWAWEEFGLVSPLMLTEMRVLLPFLCAPVAVLVYLIKKYGVKSVNLFQVAFVIFLMLYFSLPIMPDFLVVLINLLVLIIGVSVLKKGVDSFNFMRLNYGLFIISALIISRFFDTEMSFVLRGVLFVVVGAGFFMMNYVMLKKQKQKK